ncbi:MAG: protein kinase [Verrucomicrobiae bacterium]|nr:protein kinase [Verrucomicrobiae bacterium]NNJ43506.1 protein kinase [Akkermansiaceae bacterium]
MSSDTDPTDFTPPELEEIADLLPSYEILSFIAKGGMGAVYMARQKSLDRIVAIKILPRHFGEDPDFRNSFETEAKSMAKLNHPNLIGIYDFGQIDGLLYIIIEMVHGKSLYHSAYEKIIDPMEAARIVIEICNGLAHAHKHGILHRDIKPANILLDPSASPKIGDFGLARAVGDHESDSAFGTPGYTAPEVVHDPSAVDESTDVYSVGAILYQLLTSKLPDENYIPAATLVHCDFRFDQIIKKAMNPSPSMRYRDAQEMADAINKIVNSHSPARSTLIQAAPKSASSIARAPITPTRKLAHDPTTRSLNTSITPQNKATGSPKLAHNPTTGSLNTNLRARTPSPQVKTDANAPFVRNIIVIIVLLAAIAIAWEGLKVVRANRAEEDEKTAIANKEKALKDAAEKRRKAEARQAKNQKNRTPPPKRHPEVQTPRESLSQLRPLLISGSRNRMPKGTITLGGHARLYIDKSMTWHQARAFCENHGGHLSILRDASDLQWLSENLESDQVVWLGAGSAGNGSWSWIDGTPWNQKIRNTSKASYVSVDDTGVLNPQPAQTRNGFFIEWNMDGSTPASLINQLKRCADSMSSEQPQFPAGTTSYDNRHYLIIEQSGDWQAAYDLATLAGGTLATPSNPNENQWMLSFAASSLKKNHACWIGGIRKANQPWAWATGEPWSFAKWGDGLLDEDAATASACAITASQTWDDHAIDTRLPYFLIEWSNDHQGQEALNPTRTAQPRGIAPIRKKAASLIQGIQKNYERQFTSNIKGYEQELNNFKRSLTLSQQRLYIPMILDMQTDYENNRISEGIARDGMPEKLVQIRDSRLKRQDEKEAKLIAEIENLRAKYRKNLYIIYQDNHNKGLTSLQPEIQREIDETKSSDDFINHILDSQ